MCMSKCIIYLFTWSETSLFGGCNYLVFSLLNEFVICLLCCGPRLHDNHWYKLTFYVSVKSKSLILFFCLCCFVVSSFLTSDILTTCWNHNFQKASLSSTFRRLGEEIYRPRWLRVQEDGAAGNSLVPGAGASDSAADAPRDALFLRSHNQHVRLLSCFIILKTLSQGWLTFFPYVLFVMGFIIIRLSCALVKTLPSCSEEMVIMIVLTIRKKMLMMMIIKMMIRMMLIMIRKVIIMSLKGIVLDI